MSGSTESPKQLVAYVPRVDYGRLLEPRGNHILHGAGALAFSDWGPLINYVDLLDTNPPALAMSWITLNLWNITDPSSAGNWLRFLNRWPDSYIIPQIGLNFNEGEDPSKNYEDDVAAGLYDDELRALFGDLKKIRRPFFLRVGLGFNGEWNNYAPESYKAAFRRTHMILHDMGMDEVALVWDYLPFASHTEYMSYYPGDDVVDWWGIEFFSVNDLSRPNTAAFLASAAEHRRPVMICESTAYQIGTTSAQSWDQWFVPFFNFIRSHPGIKASCYINWNWTAYDRWKDWGDCRLEANAELAVKYYNELCFPPWVHAKSEQLMRSRLYIPANAVPSGTWRGYDETEANNAR